MGSLFPAVVDAAATLADAATPVSTRVFDGPYLSEDPGDYLLIGVDDPNSTATASSSGDLRQQRVAMGNVRHEEGVVRCAAYSWTGDSGAGAQKAARDAAFATVDAFEGVLRANPSLGIAAVLKTESGPALAVSQAQTESGADCLVIFTFAYLARI